ncbi:MAG: TonB family protein [Chitinispirillia bacterium]|nr:TonB family protein [Chitinispirillia bacterium]MCL2267697.1 TonB family protein [Chitinispirillia bacterium]
MSVKPENVKRTMSVRGKALFVLMSVVIAAAFTVGCVGKKSLKDRHAAGFWSGEADVSWYDEDKDTFTVNTAEELAGLALLTNEGKESFKDKVINLGRNIVISDTAKWRNWAKKPPVHKWTRIGTDDERFQGSFNGNGHTISGVYVKDTGDDQGLFGVIGYYGSVKKLNVTAAHIEGGNYAGVLAGGSFGNITECYTSGVVTGDSIVGGLVGVNDRWISNSYAAGSVKGRICVGGLIGGNRGSTSVAIGNRSSVAVSGDTLTGGFVGANWRGIMTGNFSTGKVTGNADAGGFAGRNYGVIMRSNYYDKDTSGQSDSGKGEGKATAEMRGAEFVNALNALTGISPIKAWVDTEGGYPAFSDKSADAPVSTDGYFAGGKGSGDDPYIISSKEHLENFTMFTNLGVRFSGKHLKLGQSIALNDTADWKKWGSEPPPYCWLPAGTDTSSFEGTFDGGGHIVSGVYVNIPWRDNNGFFGTAGKDAVIKNLGVTASYINGCCAVGGLVGANTGSIINSYSTATVAGEKTGAGGLVGGNIGGTIIACYATGAVSGDDAVGGLVGASAMDGTVSNSYSTGAVKGNDIVGGLMGVNNRAFINASYTTSEVSGKVPYIGPLVGWNYHGSVVNSYFDSLTSGVTDNRKGFGRTTGQMKKKETFTNWNFDVIWGMDSKVNSGYPYILKNIGDSAVIAASEPVVSKKAAWYKASESEFTISTAEELAGLAEIVNGTWGGRPMMYNFAGKTIKLAKNINLSGYDNWVPIGGGVREDEYEDDEPDAFSGTFDGGGHIISNLTINDPDKSVLGLFGYIKDANVKNLGLDSVKITGGSTVGALAGGVVNNSIVNNCYSNGTVTGKDNVGGLVGTAAANSFITNSYSTATVTSADPEGDSEYNSAGGVVGYVQHYCMVINCYSTGAVNGIGNVGGVTGMLRGQNSVRGSAALNPELKGVEDVNRVAAVAQGSLLSNNAAYADMKKSGGKDTAKTALKGAGTLGGADLAAADIQADPTLGGRFLKADGWTTERGKLPGLFGKTVEMPKHLAARGGASARPAPKAADRSRASDSASVDTLLAKAGGRLKQRLSDLPAGGTLTGGRSSTSIQRVILMEQRDAFKRIHNWREEDKPDLTGTVAVKFTIDESGKVTSAKLENSTVKDSLLENAIILRVRHIDFGKAEKAGDTAVVVYPFVFGSPQAKDVSGLKERAMPATLEECYAALDKQLSEDAKDDIAFSDRDDFLGRSHFGLGMWLRNNFIYPNEALREKFGGMHPDDISGVILRGYYNHLNGIEESDDEDED